ncbi:MAG: class II aldolase/adducin family protein [Bauldia litoralis]
MPEAGGQSGGDVRDRVSPQEWQARLDLAMAHRLLYASGVDDLTYNHLSARVPGESDALLIKPADFTFDEVTASGLLKFGTDGSRRLPEGPPLQGGALIIHAGILRARPDIDVVFHTHTPATIAVSNQAHGLLPISQHALLFHGRIAYHDFKGLEFNAGMDEALLRDLGDKRIALLRNHGALITADSVAEAVVLHHFLEFACQTQVASLAGGQELVVPPAGVVAEAARQYAEVEATRDGGKNWEALKRRAERLFPGYKS